MNNTAARKQFPGAAQLRARAHSVTSTRKLYTRLGNPTTRQRRRVRHSTASYRLLIVILAADVARFFSSTKRGRLEPTQCPLSPRANHARKIAVSSNVTILDTLPNFAVIDLAAEGQVWSDVSALARRVLGFQRDIRKR